MIDFQGDFFLFLGTLGLTICSRQLCVLLSRTMNIVIILIIFAAVITLFYICSYFIHTFLGIRVQI